MLYDAMAGLYLTRTRAYNPRTGRFLQRDKLDESGRNGIYRGFPFGSDAIGSNLYAWCRNNPTSMVDPSGHWGIRSLFGGIVRAVRSFVRAAVNTFRRVTSYFRGVVRRAASYARSIFRRHRQAVARAATPIQQALRRVVTIVRKKITAQKFTGFSGQNGFGGKAGRSYITCKTCHTSTITSPVDTRRIFYPTPDNGKKYGLWNDVYDHYTSTEKSNGLENAAYDLGSTLPHGKPLAAGSAYNTYRDWRNGHITTKRFAWNEGVTVVGLGFLPAAGISAFSNFMDYADEHGWLD
jgi:RHS repeat-associated protein